MYSLLKKEISSFLGSISGYVVIIIFLVITGLFIWVFPGELNIPEGGYATLDSLFIIAPWIFLFLVPAITMKMIAEEKKSGTIELLLTRPLNDLQILLSKYFSAIVLILFSIVPTLLYFFTIHTLSNPIGNVDSGAIWGSYIGLFFLASIYAAIGLFASSLSENQIVSFLFGIIISFFVFMGFDYVASIFEISAFNILILNFGINTHYESISRGVIDSRDIIYFISISTFFIYVTKLNLRQKNNKVEQKEKKSEFNTLILLIVVLVVINFVSSAYFFRLDLTSDKRYTLSDTSKETLKNLEDIVYIKIYLDGDLPIGFTKLKKAINEMMDDFRIYSKKIEYNFINPYNLSKDNRESLFRELYHKGIKPTNIRIKGEDGLTQKNIFPGALISYKNAETSINLLSNNPGMPAEINLNNSMQALEYNFISIIKNITASKIEKVAFIEGHGELNELETDDISNSLRKYYQVDRGIINGQTGILNDYKAIIIAKPTKPFDERDKYVIDQYIMQGGKVIWFIDAVNVNADSLLNGSTIALIRDLNLNDMLFNYGFRVNPVLVKDLQSNFIVINTALNVNQPKWTPVPWPYFPLISCNKDHPVTKNLNMVKTEYINVIDTITGNADVKKEIILSTSKASAIVKVPTFITLREIEKQPSAMEYAAGAIPVAVLAEGKFESAFKNRMIESVLGKKDPGFKSKSIDTKILVVADGDIIRNDVKYSPKGNMIAPLGYDRYTQQTFGNKEFVLNAINYLADDDGLINLRSREYKLRLLDKQKLSEEKKLWISLNILVPVIIILLYGLVSNFMRKRKYI